MRPFNHAEVRMPLDARVGHAKERVALKEAAEQTLGVIVKDAVVFVEREFLVEYPAVHRRVVFAPKRRLIGETLVTRCGRQRGPQRRKD